MEEIKDMVKVLIPILDILYNSELSFEESVGALESLIEGIRENEKYNNDKELFKTLKILFGNELEDYEKSLKEGK
ncbi:MAG: hypothetical protein HXL58_03025 [Solobacterium sp.]|nr:hypothetical protein [Solobacterium sp.]